MTDVILVASGYEWRCPDCGEVEYEAVVPSDGRVRCAVCGGSFAVASAHHRSIKGPVRPGQAVLSQTTLALFGPKPGNGSKPGP